MSVRCRNGFVRPKSNGWFVHSADLYTCHYITVFKRTFSIPACFDQHLRHYPSPGIPLKTSRYVSGWQIHLARRKAEEIPRDSIYKRRGCANTPEPNERERTYYRLVIRYYRNIHPLRNDWNFQCTPGAPDIDDARSSPLPARFLFCREMEPLTARGLSAVAQLRPSRLP